MNPRFMVLFASLSGLPACAGTTGSDLFLFDAAAAGPEDAVAGQPLSFTTGAGYAVRLDRARVHVGAVYLNKAFPTSGAQETSCVLPGTYVAEVTRGLDVDALDPSPQPFPAQGEAIEARALSGEVWLNGGAVDALADETVILDVAGAAAKDDIVYPFTGALTIGESRAIPPADPAFPGANPICKQRIVSPIAVALTPRRGARLLLRIDPRRFFDNVQFSSLAPGAGDPPLRRFEDRTHGQPNVSLYQGLRAREGVYHFSFIE